MKYYRIAIVVAGALALAIPGQADAPVYLSGMVLNKATHRPIAGATLALLQASLPTGQHASDLEASPPNGVVLPPGSHPITVQSLPNGAFAVRLSGSGSYRVEVTADNFEPFREQLVIPAGGMDAHNVLMTKRATLLLKLLGLETKTAKVQATLWISSDPWKAQVTTRSAFAGTGGIVELLLPDGSLSLKKPRVLVDVSVQDGRIGEARLDGWPTDALSIALRPGASIKGQVLGLDGKPRTGVTVLAIRCTSLGVQVPNEGPLTTNTVADGRFTFEGLTAGHYLMAAVLDMTMEQPSVDAALVDTALDTGGVTLTPGKRTIAALMQEFPFLNAGGVPLRTILERTDPARAQAMPLLRGRVVDNLTGKPIPGIPVQTVGKDEQFSIDVTRTAEDGTYQLSALPLGEVTQLKIDHRPYYPFTQEMRLPKAVDTPAEILLTPLPRLHVRLCLRDGKPASAGTAQVWFWVGSQPPSPWYADQDDIGPDGTFDALLPHEEKNFPVLKPAELAAKPTALYVRCEKQGFGKVYFPRWPGFATVVLQPSSTLAVLVLDAAKHPLPSTRVVLQSAQAQHGKGTPAGPSYFFTGRTGANGKAEIAALPPGQYTLSTWGAGEAMPTKDVTVAGPRTEVTLEPPVPEKAGGAKKEEATVEEAAPAAGTPGPKAAPSKAAPPK